MTTTEHAARRLAAADALTTHDELLAVEAIGDRFELGPDDLPVDNDGWLAWHAEQYTPALKAWTRAMDRLQAVLGSEEFPGRHPANFRPFCEHLLIETAVIAAGGAR